MRLRLRYSTLCVGFFLFAWQPFSLWAFDPSVLQRSDVNAFDRLSMLPYSKSLDTSSKVFAYASLLTPTVLVAIPKTDWLYIGIQYVESVLLTVGIKELGKTIIPRYRPYMYFDNYPQHKIDNGDFKQSMPSGHSALAFTGATFTSVVFSEHFPASKWKIPVIAGSYTLATTTAILRNASGSHFLIDIIAGASIGTFSGFIVPWVHSRYFNNIKKSNSGIENINLGIIPQGFIVTLDF